MCIRDRDKAADKVRSKHPAEISMVGQVDALIDTLYLTYGSFVLMGVDPEEVFEIVHRANMGKILDVYKRQGMGRIGFRRIEEIKEAERLLLAAGAEIEGIFTHFATADEADDRKFQAQYQFFKEVLAALEILPPIVHASNSATSLWHADTIFTACLLYTS